jgi:hypothetical protein
MVTFDFQAFVCWKGGHKARPYLPAFKPLYVVKSLFTGMKSNFNVDSPYMLHYNDMATVQARTGKSCQHSLTMLVKSS